MRIKRVLLLLSLLVFSFALSFGGVAAQEGYVVGLSNGFVSSEWRTQMIQQLETAAAELTESGTPIELIIESADVDVAGQIQQVQNLINRGVDAIIINPNDQAALNSVLEEAVESGIVVIAIDQEIGAQGVYNVVIDQKEWAMISAQWLADSLGGEGDIVLIEGAVGHPANEARMDGVEEVLANYPNIKVVGRDSGNWDQATGQQVMSDFITSLPNIDGVWTQDGMAAGLLTALMTANPEKFPIVSGEARMHYMQLWNEVRQTNPDFSSIGVVNPPGVAADGLRVAVELLNGAVVNPDALGGPFGNSFYLPIPYVVNDDNFEEIFAENSDQPTSYTLDGMISQDDAKAIIAGEFAAPLAVLPDDAMADAIAYAELVGTGPFVVGLSNGFVSSEWRTQMIQQLEAAVEDFAVAGVEIELIIESADVDVAGQIQQVQNLMNRGVHAIIINPNDQAALNSVLEEAVESGIVVIAIDQEIGAQGVYNVVIDQKEWAMLSAQWLADSLGGEGDIVLIEGAVGHPANEARMDGVEEVLANYPNIKVVGRDSGNWDQATGQQVMSDFITSLPNIDGVWTQDGMAAGLLTALMTANPEKFPIVSGEARMHYMQLWNEVRQTNPDFSSIGVVNPPGVAADGLRVAIELLTGETVDPAQLGGPFGNSLYLPIPYIVTDENFEEIFAENSDQPTSYTLDGMISQGQAEAFMVQP